MRREANIEEWKRLYEAAEKIKEIKPWEYLWDMDLICLKEEGKPEKESVFVSVLGRGGTCYGLSIYEGYEGLNDFWMLAFQDRMNLPSEYVMYSQHCLTCYWGNREELSKKQRDIIKELGYKFRGKNQWLYFMSYQPGYIPFHMNQAEVRRMTRYLELLNRALPAYLQDRDSVAFEKEEMFTYIAGKDEKTDTWKAERLPFTSFQFAGLTIQDEEVEEELRQSQKNEMVLEADIPFLGASVTDKKYERPANPQLCILAEARSQMIIRTEMTEPDEDARETMAELIVGFIENFGAPKEIRISNLILEAILEDICKLAGVKLRRVKALSCISDFTEQMRRFR